MMSSPWRSESILPGLSVTQRRRSREQEIILKKKRVEKHRNRR
jgi:hypothetical protein